MRTIIIEKYNKEISESIKNDRIEVLCNINDKFWVEQSDKETIIRIKNDIINQYQKKNLIVKKFTVLYDNSSFLWTIKVYPCYKNFGSRFPVFFVFKNKLYF